MYKSIKVTYLDESVKTAESGFYNVNKAECAPLLGDVFYGERDPFTTAIIQNNQELVRNRYLPHFYTIEKVKELLNSETNGTYKKARLAMDVLLSVLLGGKSFVLYKRKILPSAKASTH